MSKTAFKIHGMDCAEEVAVLKRALGPLLESVDRLQFDVLNGKLTVDLPEQGITVDAIQKAVAGTGMRADLWTTSGDQPNAHRPERLRHGLTAVSGVMLVAGFAWHASLAGWFDALAASEHHDASYPVPTMALYGLAVAGSIWMVLPKAWYALRAFRPDINLLMTIAVVGAVCLGNLLEAALVSFLFAIALMLEAWSVGRARRAIGALMELAPDTAHVLRTTSKCGCHHDENVRELAVGDVPLKSIVLVKPGERVPMDGRITKGETTINQAPITGESIPVEKSIGSEVFAGTINHEGAFEFETTKLAQDSSLARIIHLVEDAQSNRAPSEQWVETFAKYYTPAMVLLAIALATVPPLLTSMPWSDSIYLSLVMLLIACPCALVISTPVTIVAGISTAARMGVLIKGGAYLEAPARIKAIAIDKTGTLTKGQPSVQHVIPLNGHTEPQLLSIAASIEANSNHPLANAIVRHANERGIAFAPASAHQSVTGKGAEGTVDGVSYWIGNERMLRDKTGNGTESQAKAREHEDAGHAVMMLGSANEVLAIVCVADTVRPEARDAIAALRKAGIQQVVMLTGDNVGTAKSLAEATGVDAYYAALMPEDKVTRVRELKEKFGNIAMIGDGVNDAPAMAAADVAIAMGAAGSDAAIETADIALMSDDLSRVAWLVNHARRTLSIIKQNVVIALGLKVAVLILSLAGMATLWLAILADMGGSLIVVMNALRLLKTKENG